jgi:Co/Zn/Cd efflux system component
MDCSAEEQLLRLELESSPQVEHLEFDLPQRKLTVYHLGAAEAIQQAIHELELGDHLLESVPAEIPSSSKAIKERSILWWVLGINFGLFVVEMTAGWLASSMGLVADSLDMLADSFVYGLSLLAVGTTTSRKKKIAGMSGYFQLTLALLGFLEVTRRFLGYGEVPRFQTMIIVSILALIGNAVCLYLIQKARSDEAHMKASWIFTSNDIVVNLGVIVAGILVYITSSRVPDLVVGTVVFVVVINGAFRILKLAK